MLLGLLHRILTLRNSLNFCFNRDSWILFEKIWRLFSSWVRAFRFVSDVNFIFKIFLERIFRVTWECEKAYISQLCDEANTKMVLIWRLLSCVSFTCSTKTQGPYACLEPCYGSTCWSLVWEREFLLIVFVTWGFGRYLMCKFSFYKPLKYCFN